MRHCRGSHCTRSGLCFCCSFFVVLRAHFWVKFYTADETGKPKFISAVWPKENLFIGASNEGVLFMYGDWQWEINFTCASPRRTHKVKFFVAYCMPRRLCLRVVGVVEIYVLMPTKKSIIKYTPINHCAVTIADQSKTASPSPK